MKRMLIPVISLFLFISSVFIYFNSYKKNIPDLNCYAQVRYGYFNDKEFDVMDTGIGFMLENGEGTISYSATLKKDNSVFNIKRDIKVTYKVTDNNSYLMTVSDIKVSPLDNLPDNLSYPYMYGYTREAGGWFNVNVKENGPNSYIMYTTTIPQFFCKKT
ncbi:hypothetical protein ABN128_29835 [Klebsiella variicola subsp. variicola]